MVRFDDSDSFMTEIRVTDADDHSLELQSPSSRYETKHHNPFEHRFEDEDTTRTRTFLYLWYDLTQEVSYETRH